MQGMDKNDHQPTNDFDSTLIQKTRTQLEQTGKLAELRKYWQHGRFSVYDHSLSVADLALRIARRLPFRFDEASLVRGALLHDYFLYDWHIPERGRPLHGFYHPKTALDNARRDYGVNDTESDIIRHHMFPLTLIPPRTREGLVVCLADKICAFRETPRRKPKINPSPGAKDAP